MNMKITIIVALLAVVLICGALVALLPNDELPEDTGDSIMTTPISCTHASYGEWKDMGNYHTRKCKDCSFTQSSEHGYGLNNKCVACGKEKPKTNLAEHECDFDKSVKLKLVSSTCTVKGSYSSPCKVEGCSKTTVTELPLVEHSYNGRVSQYNESNHLILCEWCEKFKYQQHDFNEGLVTKPATCTAGGLKTFTCKVAGCGYIKQVTLQAPGHNYANGTCTVCNNKCTNHLYGSGYKCNYCGLACTHARWSNGLCTDCNYACSHPYYRNGICYVCAIPCVHPDSEKIVEATGDGGHYFVCSLCHGGSMWEEHYDLDGDNYCDARDCFSFVGSSSQCEHPEDYKHVDTWGKDGHTFVCTMCHTSGLSESHYDYDGDNICDARDCFWDLTTVSSCEHPDENKYVEALGTDGHYFVCTKCHQSTLYESHYDNDGDGICDARDCNQNVT